jgi:hypothetical protein
MSEEGNQVIFSRKEVNQLKTKLQKPVCKDRKMVLICNSARQSAHM